MSSATHCESHTGVRKRIYATKQDAKAAITAKWLVPYECPDCGFWHVSFKRRSKPSRVR